MSTEEQRPLQEHLAALAAEFVQAGKDAGLNLDFQPRTLPFVDKFMAANRGSHDNLAMPAGAYVGEVIRRETGGLWYEHEGKPALDVGEHQVDPIATIGELFEKGRAQFGEMKIDTCKQYCEWIVRMQRQWLEATLLGTADSMATLRTSMTTDAKLAGVMVAQCQQAIQSGRLTWGESLDFTPDSLDGVERVLGKMHNHFKYAAGAAPTDEQLNGTARTWGIYVGEVIRRHYGGQWSAAEDGTLTLAVGEATISPIAKARKRIVDGPTENIRYYFASMTKVLQG
jgi:hypothetical protein